jgi:hypothetical protein
MRKRTQRDPAAAFVRESIASRRIAGRKCECAEARPFALTSKGTHVTCYECLSKKKGKSTVEDHHVAGEANDCTTIPVPGNDHRAELSQAQYDWPKQTRENPNGCPLLASAGCIRGFADTDAYLIEKLLLRRVEMLETLSVFLIERLGPEWWINTEMEQFLPRRKKPVR